MCKEIIFIQTIKTNVIGTLNMLGLAKRVGARLEIFPWE
jgi:FlaA1/EpsC-like NDP-sugar epimerase